MTTIDPLDHPAFTAAHKLAPLPVNPLTPHTFTPKTAGSPYCIEYCHRHESDPVHTVKSR